MTAANTQAEEPALSVEEKRALLSAVVQAKAFFAREEVVEAEPGAAIQPGPMLSWPCPGNALWRFELYPAGRGAEQFVGVFVNVLTGAAHALAPRIGPDVALQPTGLGAVVTEASGDGFRNRVIQVTLDPNHPERIGYHCVYDAPSHDAQIRLVAAGAEAPFVLAVCIASSSSTVLWVSTDGAAPVVPLAEGCHPRVLAAADCHTIVISDPDDGGCRLRIFKADTLAPKAQPATAAWSDRMPRQFVEALRLDGTDLHVITHEGPQMSLWRLGLETGTLEPIPLPDDLPCPGVTFAPDAEPTVILQQADLHPVKLPISVLLNRPIAAPELAPCRERDLKSWRMQVPSDDGTRIDLTLCARRDLLDAEDHPQQPLPTLLYSYASYGRPSVSDFCPHRAALIQGGMLYVMAHLRGGGEYGPAWHRAGRNARRGQSSDDLDAVADALVARGYSRKDGLIGTSRSAGCQIFALSAARRPDLFRGLVLHYPVLNVCRLFASDASRGSVADLDEWADGAALQPAICPTKQATGAARTPHCLIDMSLQDTRCPPEQAASWLAATAPSPDSLRLVRLHADAAHGTPLAPHEARETQAFIRWVLDQPVTARRTG